MCSHLKNPRFPIVKAVYCFDASSVVIYQKSTFRSRQEKYPVFMRLSMASCIWGNGYKSFLVLTFNLWKSMQKHRPWSFFLTNLTVLHHGVWLWQIVPTSNISFMWTLTSSKIWGGILWNLFLMCSSSTMWISCFTRIVHPYSPGSSEKLSWYSVSRAWADAQLAPDHPSSPEKCSCWRSVSLLHSIDIFVCQISCISSNFSNVPGITSTGGTLFAATMQAILIPLPIVIDTAVWFLITMATHLSPVVISV